MYTYIYIYIYRASGASVPQYKPMVDGYGDEARGRVLAQSEVRHSATYCNAPQHNVTHCNTIARKPEDMYWRNLRFDKLQHTVSHCNTLQHTITHCNTLQQTETDCNRLQHTATRCNASTTSDTTLYPTATHCSTLPLTATHCNTGATSDTTPHAATHCKHTGRQVQQMAPHHAVSHGLFHLTHCLLVYRHAHFRDTGV